MIVFNSLSKFQNWRETYRGNIGLVPTMGALHEGHMTLVREAKKTCDFTVVSIFVNPTQFNNPDDLKKYPRTIDADTALLADAGADAIILPTYTDIYPDSFHFKVTETTLSTRFCGAHRPGHFDGVLTIVLKLFNIVRPKQAFFGEKDYQQYKLIKQMAAALFVDVNVIGVPTVREADGLAMSSRNLLLSPTDRERAPILNRVISNSKTPNEAKQRLSEEGFIVDYVEDFEGRRLAAATIGGVRLIDNVEIQHG